jgi:hypothetical protein
VSALGRRRYATTQQPPRSRPYREPDRIPPAPPVVVLHMRDLPASLRFLLHPFSFILSKLCYNFRSPPLPPPSVVLSRSPHGTPTRSGSSRPSLPVYLLLRRPEGLSARDFARSRDAPAPSPRIPEEIPGEIRFRGAYPQAIPGWPGQPGCPGGEAARGVSAALRAPNRPAVWAIPTPPGRLPRTQAHLNHEAPPSCTFSRMVQRQILILDRLADKPHPTSGPARGP